MTWQTTTWPRDQLRKSYVGSTGRHARRIKSRLVSSLGAFCMDNMERHACNSPPAVVLALALMERFEDLTTTNGGTGVQTTRHLGAADA
jgi:hypothetical protein